MQHEGQIRLSHSFLEVFLSCERKLQLDRLLAGGPEKEDWPTTVFGKAYGIGVATYLATQDIEKAIWETWLGYQPVLIDEGRRTPEICVNLVQATVPYMDSLLQDWEVAEFQGKPAIEMNFRLDIDEKFYFVGYVDVVLKNRWTNKYAIFECKHTGLNLFDLDPLYKNSGQALGYSIVLDEIVGKDQSEYDVIYCSGQLGSGNGFSPKIHILPYPKTLMDRFNWFITLGMDVERLRSMLEMNIFPQRGAACLKYNKPCIHLGTCGLHGFDVYKTPKPDDVVYQFHYKLEDVIANHLSRITQTSKEGE